MPRITHTKGKYSRRSTTQSTKEQEPQAKLTDLYQWIHFCLEIKQIRIRTSWCFSILVLKYWRRIGARPSQLDQGLFIFPYQSEIVGIVILFVDDVIWAGKTTQ